MAFQGHRNAIDPLCGYALVTEYADDGSLSDLLGGDDVQEEADQSVAVELLSSVPGEMGRAGPERAIVGKAEASPLITPQ